MSAHNNHVGRTILRRRIIYYIVLRNVKHIIHFLKYSTRYTELSFYLITLPFLQIIHCDVYVACIIKKFGLKGIRWTHYLKLIWCDYVDTVIICVLNKIILYLWAYLFIILHYSRKIKYIGTAKQIGRNIIMSRTKIY